MQCGFMGLGVSSSVWGSGSVGVGRGLVFGEELNAIGDRATIDTDNRLAVDSVGNSVYSCGVGDVPLQHHNGEITMNAQQMIVAARKSGGAFACLHRYESSTETIATYYLRLGVTRAYTLEQSIQWADRVNFNELSDITGIDADTCRAGLAEQVASWRKSLDGMQRADNFDTVATAPSGRRIFSLKTDNDGNLLPDNGLYLTAIREDSVVHVQGKARPGPKSDKAKVKANIRRMAPIGSFRTYNLRADNFDSFTFGKDTLTPSDITSVVASLTA
ncbi:hypothetical protein CMI37_28030 [Candidatus Pacearchaeota archaeon]|nr:hypothetical protein [Candidatus Pacearchaeota archaeon]